MRSPPLITFDASRYCYHHPDAKAHCPDQPRADAGLSRIRSFPGPSGDNPPRPAHKFTGAIGALASGFPSASGTERTLERTYVCFLVRASFRAALATATFQFQRHGVPRL